MKPLTAVVVGCVMAVISGCSSSGVPAPTTPASTPDMSDKTAELLGPIVQREGGRLSGVSITKTSGHVFATSSAADTISYVTFRKNTKFEDIPLAASHLTSRASIDFMDFDLENYLKKISETSKNCNNEKHYWTVDAETISPSAVVVTQYCSATEQRDTFLNGKPLIAITTPWSQENFTTLWNELLTVSPKGAAREIYITGDHAEVVLTTEPDPIPCEVAYERDWKNEQTLSVDSISSGCGDEISENTFNLDTHTAEETWAQIQALAKENDILFDEKTKLSLVTHEGAGTSLEVSRMEKIGTIHFDDPK